MAVDRDAKTEWSKSGTLTVGARHFAHVTLDLFTLRIAFGIGMPALQPRNETFELRVVGTLTAVTVFVADLDPTGCTRSVQQKFLLLLGQLLERNIGVNLIDVADRFKKSPKILGACARPWSQRTFGDAQVGIGDDEFGINFKLGAKTITVLAGAIRRVERKVSRRQFLITQSTRRATEVL